MARSVLKLLGNLIHLAVRGLTLHTTVLGRCTPSHGRKCTQNMCSYRAAYLYKFQGVYAIGASMNGIANIKNLGIPNTAVAEWDGWVKVYTQSSLA